jgi:hypothetical protein
MFREILMKLKGINALEQHFDKGIVGAMGLVLVGVLGVQFLTNPNMVTVGKSQPVPPGEAFVPVEEAALALQGRLDPKAGEALVPPASTTELLAKYRDRIAQGVTPRPALASLGSAVALGEASRNAGIRTDAPIAIAPLPAPTGSVSFAYANTIDPFEVIRNDALRAVLPKEQPFDKQSVTVEAVFDGTELRKAFETDPDGDGPARAVPRGWLDGAVEILGVQIEREQYLGDSFAVMAGAEPSGDWGQAVIVPSMPGGTDLVSQALAEVKSLEDLSRLISDARSSLSMVQRPGFPSTIAGPKWMPPTEAVQAEATTGGKDPAEVLKAEIADLDKRIKQIERSLGGSSGGRTTREDTRGVEGGAKGKSRDAQAKPDPRKQRQESRRDELARLKAAKEQELQKVRSGSDSSRTEAADRLVAKGTLEDPAIRLWAHDFNAEPGAIYRYRIRAVVNNPLFGRGGGEDPAYKAPVVYGSWSEWGEPIAVLPSEAFFVTSATPRSPTTGSVNAGVECYVFYYGFYRRANALLEPGDTIVATAKSLPTLYIFDEEKLKEGRRPDGLSPAVAPTGEPDTRGPEGTPRIAPPSGVPNTTSIGGEAAFDDQDGLLKPALKEIAINIDQIFLDAVSTPDLTSPVKSPAGMKSIGQALFGLSEGSITTRFPEIERASSVYKHIAASFELGKTQGQPKPEEQKPEIEREEAPTTPHGHDGEGGGGG